MNKILRKNEPIMTVLNFIEQNPCVSNFLLECSVNVIDLYPHVFCNNLNSTQQNTEKFSFIGIYRDRAMLTDP